MSVFRKSYATKGAAEEALRRTAWLRAKGFRTPDARCGAVPNELAFDHIAGASRFDLLDIMPMTALLTPLGALHDLAAVSLPRFDPLLRIRPRLSTGDPGWLTAALDRIGAERAKGTALLHGDFHVGQLIVDSTGAAWLIDLDDLALGPPEADLGNFIAHLATSRDVARGGFEESLDFWRGEVLGGWATLGRRYDPDRLDLFLRLALIRRHLKLRGSRWPDYGAVIERYLSSP